MMQILYSPSFERPRDGSKLVNAGLMSLSNPLQEPLKSEQWNSHSLRKAVLRNRAEAPIRKIDQFYKLHQLIMALHRSI